MRYTDLSQLPKREAERWELSPMIDGYPQRHISYDFSVIRGVAASTLEQFLEEASERLGRWCAGSYYICEAAQIIADSTPGIDAKEICRQMEAACHAGELVLRLNGIPVQPEKLDGRSQFNRIVRRTDLNEWLAKVGAGFELPNFDPFDALETPPRISEQPGTGVPLTEQSAKEKWEALTERRRSQIVTIERSIEDLGFKALSIPEGGKRKIQMMSKERAKDLFGGGDDPFLEAWKVAVKLRRIRTKKHDQYARK